MKPSHLRAPRSLDECYFEPGYRSAAKRDRFAEYGHLALNAVCAIGLVLTIAWIILRAA